jgi:hypothetical protein
MPDCSMFGHDGLLGVRLDPSIPTQVEARYSYPATQLSGADPCGTTKLPETVFIVPCESFSDRVREIITGRRQVPAEP